MSEQKQSSTHENKSAPSTHEGHAPAAPGAWRRLLAKKWVFPAVYMAAAAIILTLLWVYQNSGAPSEDSVDIPKTVTQDNGKTDDSLPANAGAGTETMRIPAAEGVAVEVVRPYFDSEAENGAKQAAVIQNGSEFTLHTGIDYQSKDGQPFDVLAALSGTVTRAETDPVVGKLVEITHPNGLVTVYQSLSEITVAKGVTVKQGDTIAKAGRNELEKDLGYHVHFEVRKGDSKESVNPAEYLNP
ncbi:peptidoglycan DD-metalloendopeptidase family protein [Paenibacillus thermoaerophilus]|uniref:Peptidoglycan DD-metalloendopeptidase family protein n=2 Tax=Paenibacillus thermoaerophilus TaxID=1215385 RepID=A0ABW2V7F1_9BACL|nr:M23 family metallopeptidase [Paenibacillus thermoaerophilus]